MKWILILPAAVVVVACAAAVSTSPESEFEGVFSSGFEQESFRPCGGEERWWVAVAEGLHERYRAATTRPYEEVYVVVRGDTSGVGEFGHLGLYRRYLRVSEVLELRPLREGECPVGFGVGSRGW